MIVKSRLPGESPILTGLSVNPLLQSKEYGSVAPETIASNSTSKFSILHSTKTDGGSNKTIYSGISAGGHASPFEGEIHYMTAQEWNGK